MAKVVFIRKASRKILAVFMAMLFTISCFVNMGTLTVHAASSRKVTVDPILESFDKNYANYSSAVNRMLYTDAVKSCCSMDIAELFLKTCEVKYQITEISGKKYTIKLPDFTCYVALPGIPEWEEMSKVESGGISVAIRDNDGSYPAIAFRKGDRAYIRAANSEITTKSLVFTETDIKRNLGFTAVSNEAYETSMDVAMLITVLGGFYKPKTRLENLTAVSGHRELAAYLGNYVVEHGKEASNIREEVIKIAKAKDGKVTEADFKHLYASGQSNRFTELVDESGIKTQWSICNGLTIDRSGTSLSDKLTVRRWDLISECGDSPVVARFVNDRKIEFKWGRQVIKIVTCSLPSDKLILEFERGELVDTNTLTLSILIDKALYDYASYKDMI